MNVQSNPNHSLYVYIGLFALVMLVASLSCSLATEAPPTLAPNTPMSTITPDSAIQPPTLEPGQQPGQVGDFDIAPPAEVATSIPPEFTYMDNLNLVDAGRMMQDINTLVGFRTRHVLSEPSATTGIDAAKEWLIGQLKAIETEAETANPSMIIDVFPHQFYMSWAGKDLYPTNIIMSITGTDAAAGVVMVGSHYDTTLQDWYNGDGYQPGADDNASGIAAVLELARIMSKKPHRATVVFVFFAAEETGRQGSQAFINDWLLPNNIPVIAFFNLDNVGSPLGRRGERNEYEMRIYSDAPNTSEARQLARMVHVAAGLFVPEMILNVHDRVDRPNRWGDQMSFSENGYPAVRLIEQTDDFSIMHTPRDLVDRIDPAYLQRTTQVTLAGLQLLADGQNGPTLRPLRPSPTDPGIMVLEWSHNPLCKNYIIALRTPDSLVYDQFFTVEATTSLAWGGFRRYEAVAVSCVDENGRPGRFSPELAIPQDE